MKSPMGYLTLIVAILGIAICIVVPASLLGCASWKQVHDTMVDVDLTAQDLQSIYAGEPLADEIGELRTRFAPVLEMVAAKAADPGAPHPGSSIAAVLDDALTLSALIEDLEQRRDVQRVIVLLRAANRIASRLADQTPQEPPAASESPPGDLVAPDQ